MFAALADRALLLADRLDESGAQLLASHARSLFRTLSASPGGAYPYSLTLDPSLAFTLTMQPAQGQPVTLWTGDEVDPIIWPALWSQIGAPLLAEYPAFIEPRPGVSWSQTAQHDRVRLSSLGLYARTIVVLTDLTEWLTAGPVSQRRADGRRDAGDLARDVLGTYVSRLDEYVAVSLGVVEDHARMEESTTPNRATVTPLRLRKD